MNKNAISLFCKLPLEGEVKTRLAADTNPLFAKEIYILLLNRIILDFNKLLGSRIDIYYYIASNHTEEFYHFVNKSFGLEIDKKAIRVQKGESLGTRMINTFEELFSDGYKNVIIAGSDIASKLAGNIQNGFALLEYNQYVVGPSYDGGFYLIGANRRFDETLFDNIIFSTNNVYNKLMENINRRGNSCGVLDMLIDIDTLDDLKMAIRDGLIKEDKIKKMVNDYI